jgi:hypothetical protein
MTRRPSATRALACEDGGWFHRAEGAPDFQGLVERDVYLAEAVDVSHTGDLDMTAHCTPTDLSRPSDQGAFSPPCAKPLATRLRIGSRGLKK